MDFIFCHSVLFDGCLRLCVLGRLEMVAKIAFIIFFTFAGQFNPNRQFRRGQTVLSKTRRCTETNRTFNFGKNTPKGMRYVI